MDQPPGNDPRRTRPTFLPGQAGPTPPHPVAPPPRSGRKGLVLGVLGAVALAAVTGGVVWFAKGDGEKEPPVAVSPSSPARPSSGVAPSPGGVAPSASIAPTGPYKKVVDPCPFVAQKTVARLVPRLERDAYGSDGAGTDKAFAACMWETQYLKGAATQLDRKLDVRLTLRTSTDVKDSVTNAGDDYRVLAGQADGNQNKKDLVGDPYGPVVALPGLGDEAFSQTHIAVRHNLRYVTAVSRVGNVLVQVVYTGREFPTGFDLDAARATPGDEQEMNEGAKAALGELVEKLRACTTCMGS